MTVLLLCLTVTRGKSFTLLYVIPTAGTNLLYVILTAGTNLLYVILTAGTNLLLVQSI